MIKGVNKRIVEVSFPESVYFEKAVLFLRTESIGKGRAELEEEARLQMLRLENGISPTQISPAKIKARIAAGRIANIMFRISVVICAAAALVLLIR